MPVYDINAVLTSVDWKSDYANVRDWTSKQTRQNYFTGLAETDTVTFRSDKLAQIRKNQVLIISCCGYGETPAYYDEPKLSDLEKVNYMYFTQDDKEWFYFVNSVDYAGVHQAALSLTLDVWNTYYFDFTLEESYIERAHVVRWNKNGTPTYDCCNTAEGLQFGDDYHIDKILDVQQTKWGNNRVYFIICVSTEEIFSGQPTGIYGTTQPFYIAMIPFVNEASFLSLPAGTEQQVYLSYEQLLNIVKSRQSIVNLFITPTLPTTINTRQYIDVDGWILNTTTISDKTYYYLSPKCGDIVTVGTPATPFNDYIDYFRIPFEKEFKASCFPYTYYELASCRGYKKLVKPQYVTGDMSGPTIIAYINYVLSVGSETKEGYGIKNYSEPANYNISTNPSLMDIPRINDAYLNFLQTKKASYTAGLINAGVSAGVQGVGAAINGNAMGLIGAATNLFTQINSSMAYIQDLKNTPDQVSFPGNDYVFEFINKTLGLQVYSYSTIQIEKVKNYFKHFGYAVKEFRKPDLKCRKYFNFIKTIGANITGDLPNSAREAIANIFDNGVTIWHETAKMYNFSYQNDEVEE